MNLNIKVEYLNKMPKGRKIFSTGSGTRVTLCNFCDKTYSCNDIRKVEYLMKVHMRLIHKSEAKIGKLVHLITEPGLTRSHTYDEYLKDLRIKK